MKRTALKRTEFKRKPPKQTAPKKRKCRGCGESYVQFNSFHKCVDCQVKMAKAAITPGTPEHKKRRNQAKRDFKAKHDLSWWKKQAQIACNTYIRHRDTNEPCVTCGKPKGGQKIDAGHFRTVGAHGMLRYCEQNIHAQHTMCNQHDNDISRYKSELQIRYGPAMVEWLCRDHPVYKWRIQDLMAIVLYYRNMLKLLDNPDAKVAYKLRGYERITAEVEYWTPSS